ncbi:acetyl-CoA synthetase-like protein [Periconia macrospinosa]|uniref:Acetyl-CoA synthetase-like protein n=1 Tax=Periconia macrospinosa TaxID=97972 RepID=A0A2V1DUF9_9PLEO|nr:acetyl-CoA synthetase-like protein [Periconia macrospinosa]
MNTTWTLLTPTVARWLDPDTVPSLRTLTLGGERAVSMDWTRWNNHVQVINGYGPAECSVVCTACSNVEGLASGTIGKSIASVSWVVDPSDHNRLARFGSVGELLVEGPILARGYLEDAEKTATAFIYDPPWLVEGCAQQSGRRGRLYKTGDLVHYDAQGNLVYVGRKDEQVKVHGQQVELGEIEHHVRECMPAVAHMAVEVIVPGEKDKAMVAAFLQLEGETEEAMQIIFPAEVDSQLCERLPRYMVPGIYFAVAQLPMTTSGKTDRKRLREMGAAFSTQQLAELRTHSQEPKRPPSTAQDKVLQRLWAQALNIKADSIGLDDSFFCLGGDSIAAMKLVAQARQEEHLQLTVADIFRTPRLHHLASQTVHSLLVSPSAIPRVSRSGPVVQSFAQARLWLLDELHPELDWYLMPFAARIKGPLQLDALEAALHTIECRHETLRTIFSTTEGSGLQEVLSFQAKELEIIDVCSEDEQDLLDAHPGWRVTVYRVNEQYHVLSIVMHHIISDGWSLDLLQRELATLYSAAIRGQDLISHLPPLPIQYCDFSIWQRQQEQIEEHQRQLDYWVTELQTSRPAEFLCDNPRPATLSGKAGAHQLTIDGQIYHELQQFCIARGVTPFVVLLAAFRATHYRLTNQDDATIGFPNANRDRWECLRTKIVEETFEELVQQVHTAVVASFANQDSDRDMSRNPLKRLGKLALEGVEIEAVYSLPTSRFDLEFHFFQEEHGLRGHVLFSEDLYRAETISSLISVFQSILHHCLDEPRTKIASAPLLTNEAYAQLEQMGLLHSNETQYPRESSIVELFRQQVAAHPSRIAVKDSLSEMTYAQLDALSDGLAQWLYTKSFPTETMVGVIADRSCQTIVALLGILKAGLAYLPFDVNILGPRMDMILSSIEGGRLVLVGDGIQPPELGIDGVQLVQIAEVLSKVHPIAKPFHAAVEPSANSLAYVMFTSGSTGRPKGVRVEHRGIVRLVKGGNLSRLLPPYGAMAHLANLAFDASTWEIYAALLNGMTLACIDRMKVLDHIATLQLFTGWNVRAAFLTPTLFGQYAIHSPGIFSTLAMLIVGGERLDQSLIIPFINHFAGNFVNGYGPTENTTFSTMFHLKENETFTNGVPIGRAISNSGAYVMDSEQRLVPLGVIGELVVTGDGLARGYTDLEHNVDRFLTVKIGDKKIRAYRTGDYVRYRPTDGQLEFIGRIDAQVKIRGHRVELGEIENFFRSHRSVHDAVVVSKRAGHNDLQLFAYITLEGRSAMPDGWHEETSQLRHVESWEDRFDSDTYASIENLRLETIGRSFVGWTSMYDGSEIDKAEMGEWIDDTINTIYAAAHGQPGNVLEIGSGTGMVLFNLVDELQSYVGLDPSRKAVKFILETAKSIPALNNKVRMYKATAAEVFKIERLELAEFVVLNSVVQYFPSQEYLFKVVESLLNLGGVKTIFLGDVRSYALHRDFLVTKALRMSGHGPTKKDIRHMVEDMEQVERELLVDPGFFTALPSRLPDFVEYVEILPKRMKATNELSCYRYAAVIHAKVQGQPEQEFRDIGHEEWVDFEEHRLNRQSLQSLLQQLTSFSSPFIIAISNIPHSKTIFNKCLLSFLDDGKATEVDSKTWVSSIRQAAKQIPSLSAVDLVELAEEAGCSVDISWSRQYSQRGGLDAVFHRESGDRRVKFRFPTDHAGRQQHSFSSQPLRPQYAKEVQHQLEELLRSQLPVYMIPQSVHVLDSFPVNPNGKVDRRALAQRMYTNAASQDTLREPSTEQQKTMQRLWARVLNIQPEHIGLDDSFFHLGGDSITTMKLVAEARKQGLQLTIADVLLNAGGRTVIDWHLETTPPIPSIMPELSNLPAPKDVPEVIILTGCSGLLGHHLLNSLMGQARIRKIICVAVRRLSEYLNAEQLPPPSDRVVYYEGDLTLPFLGLRRDQWCSIFGEVDAVIHNGADTSSVKYFSALRAVNVESTQQITSACLQRMIPIHYISTMATTPFTKRVDLSAKPSNNPNTTPPTDGAQGYICSKWVCENMLERVFAQYGLPVVIHRPANIIRNGRDAVTGSAHHDVVHSLLHYSHSTQSVPKLNNDAVSFNLVPVETCCNDIVSHLLRYTAPDDDAEITYVNNVGKVTIPITQLEDIGLAKIGRKYKVLQAEEWVRMVVSAGMHPAVAAIIENFNRR